MGSAFRLTVKVFAFLPVFLGLLIAYRSTGWLLLAYAFLGTLVVMTAVALY